MAASRRTGRTRGTRGSRRESAAAEPAALEFSDSDRPSRGGRGRGTSRGAGMGSGIGMMIPLAVTVGAGVVLLAGGFFVASSAKAGIQSTLDKTGTNVALALASIPTKWWQQDHGATDFFQELQDQRDASIARAKKSPDYNSETADLIKQQYKKMLKDWNIQPEPNADARRHRIEENNRGRLATLIAAPGSTIVYADITPADSNVAFQYSGRSLSESDPGTSRTIGNVTVTPETVTTKDYSGPAVRYDAQGHDEFGNPAGKARVILSAKPAEEAAAGLTTSVLIVTLVGLLVVGAVAFSMCIGASKGVMRVAQSLDQVARGDLDVRIAARGAAEVASLARSADRAMKTFRAVQSQAIEASTSRPPPVEVTTVDGSQLLPGEPPRLQGFEIEAVHKPAQDGGKDFYDYIDVDEGHLGIVIADMPHAGPAGAFIASTFRALMRAFAQGEHSPAVVLGKVNRIMAGELKRGDHITAMYTILDKGKDIVSVASAGHLPLVFWKLEKKASALLNPEGIAIGLDKGPVFEKTVVDKRIKLDRGDRYVLYTDGPVAATNADGEEFGEQRFYYLVNREAPKNSAAFVNFVANEVDLFHEGAVQQDDITLVTVRKV